MKKKKRYYCVGAPTLGGYCVFDKKTEAISWIRELLKEEKQPIEIFTKEYSEEDFESLPDFDGY